MRSSDAKPIRARAGRGGRSPFRLRGDLLVFIGIVLAAWAARILLLLCQPDAHAPTSLLYWGDAQTYLQSAMASMRGVPWDSGIPFHPPGFTTFLAGLLRLVGAPASPSNFDALPLKVVLALLGAVTVGIFYLIAQRLAGRAVALAALPLSIFSFGHGVQSTTVNVEGTFLLLELVFVLGAIELAARLRGDVGSQTTSEQPTPAHRTGRLLLAAALGLLAGAAALMRPEFLLAVLLTAAVLLFAGRHTGRRRARLPIAALLLATILVLIPWTIRCYHNVDAVNRANAARLPRPLPRLVLISAGGPMNFATANNDFASGVFDTRLIERLVPNRASLALDLAQPDVNRLYIDGYRIGLGWIFSHPGRAIALIARKCAFAGEALAIGYLPDDFPAGLTGERRPVDQFVPRSKWLLWVQLALCLAGAWRLRGRIARVPTALLLAPAVATLTAIVAFFGYVRFGMLLAPVFWILLGAGWLAIVERVPWPRFVRADAGRSIAALIGVLLLVAVISAARGPRHYALSGNFFPGTQQLNQDDRVLLEVRR
jgi:hypothetical protein